MERPVTSHVASVPPRPGFVAFEPRAVLALCHGAGLRSATPILTARELAAGGEG